MRRALPKQGHLGVIKEFTLQRNLMNVNSVESVSAKQDT